MHTQRHTVMHTQRHTVMHTQRHTVMHTQRHTVMHTQSTQWCTHKAHSDAHTKHTVMHTQSTQWCTHKAHSDAHTKHTVMHTQSTQWCTHKAHSDAHTKHTVMHTQSTQWCTHKAHSDAHTKHTVMHTQSTQWCTHKDAQWCTHKDAHITQIPTCLMIIIWWKLVIQVYRFTWQHLNIDLKNHVNSDLPGLSYWQLMYSWCTTVWYVIIQNTTSHQYMWPCDARDRSIIKPWFSDIHYTWITLGWSALYKYVLIRGLWPRMFRSLFYYIYIWTCPIWNHAGKI